MKYISIIVALLFIIFTLSDNDKKQKEYLEESPHGRIEWRNNMRGGTNTPENVIKARNKMRSNFKKSKQLKDGGLNKWIELNAHQEGGRVRAIAVHPTDPNVLFAGSVSGGIWKSEDQGASWSALNDFLPSLSISSIIIHPDHPDTMYAATGEGIIYTNTSRGGPGAGIFRSVDGGANWHLVGALDANDLEDFYWVNDIRFDPVDPSKFYATKSGSDQTSSSGGCAQLFLFSNHGATKSEIDIECRLNATKIFISPFDADLMMVCHDNGLQISTDKGQNWNEMNSTITGWPSVSGRVEVAISEDEPNTIFALCGGEPEHPLTGAPEVLGVLLKSVDDGANWTTINSGLTIFGDQGCYNNTIWIDPDDSDKMILGGVNLWRSTNGGTILISISDGSENDNGLSAHADHHIIVPAANYSAANKKLYFGNDGGVASTDDWSTVSQTSGWDLLNNGLNITQFYSSDINGANPQRILAGAQDNGTLRTSDSGSTWEKVGGGDGGICAYSRQNNDLQYLTAQNGAVQVKCDNASWMGSFAPYFFMSEVDSNPSFITPLAINPIDGEELLVAGTKMYKLTFNAVTCLPDTVNVSPRFPDQFNPITSITYNADATHVYVGYDNGLVYRGAPAGNTFVWSLIFQNTNSFHPISSIAVHPTNSNKVAISLGGYLPDNVLISTNAEDGPTLVTWTPRSNGLPEVHINSLAWHPEFNSWLYAGTDLGIMATEDNGANWNVTPNFMNVSDGPAFVEISKLQFTEVQTLGGHHMIATTFGRGIWKTQGLVRKDVYVDEDNTAPANTGREDSPFESILDAEEVQAHGQTWYIDGGTYDSNGGVKITKRIGKVELTGSGPVIIK